MFTPRYFLDVEADASDIEGSSAEEDDATGESVVGKSRRRTIPQVRDTEEDDTSSSDEEDDETKARRVDAELERAVAQAEADDAERQVAALKARLKASSSARVGAPAKKRVKMQLPTTPNSTTPQRPPSLAGPFRKEHANGTSCLLQPNGGPPRPRGGLGPPSKPPTKMKVRVPPPAAPTPSFPAEPFTIGEPLIPKSSLSTHDPAERRVSEWSESIVEASAKGRARVTDHAVEADAVALAMAKLVGFSVCDRRQLKWPDRTPSEVASADDAVSWDRLARQAERCAQAAQPGDHACIQALCDALGLGVGEASDYPALDVAVTFSPRALTELLQGDDMVHCVVEMRELRLPASLDLLRQAMGQAVSSFPQTHEVYQDVMARAQVLLRSFRDENGLLFTDSDVQEVGTVAVVCPIMRFTHHSVDGGGASACKAYLCPDTLHVLHLVGRNHAFSFSCKAVLPYTSMLNGSVTMRVSSDKVVFAVEQPADKVHRPQSVLLQRLNAVAGSENATLRRLVLPLEDGEDDHNVTREGIRHMEPTMAILLSRAALTDLSSVFDRKVKTQRVISLNMFEHGIQVREGGQAGTPEVTEPLACFGGFKLSSPDLKPAVDLLKHAQRLGFVDNLMDGDTPAYTSVDGDGLVETLGKHLAQAHLSASGLKTLTRCSGPWLLILAYGEGNDDHDSQDDAEPTNVVAMRSLAVDTRGLNVSEAIVGCRLGDE